MKDVILGIFIPFFGTSLGAALVFFMRGEMNKLLKAALVGAAGGIMVAASVWSLIIPAIDRSGELGKLSFLPAAIGLMLGVAFLMLIDKFAPTPEGSERRSSMMFAVTLHNLPEGMAVGAIFAGFMAGESLIPLSAAMALALGVAIQNLPEGAIVSMSSYAEGKSRWRALAQGVMSGAVEPLGAFLTVIAVGQVLAVLPYLLGFAAGAMLYVVVHELVPEIAESGHFALGNIMFALGFCIMMSLDVALS